MPARSDLTQLCIFPLEGDKLFIHEPRRRLDFRDEARPRGERRAGSKRAPLFAFFRAKIPGKLSSSGSPRFARLGSNGWLIKVRARPPTKIRHRVLPGDPAAPRVEKRGGRFPHVKLNLA